MKINNELINMKLMKISSFLIFGAYFLFLLRYLYKFNFLYSFIDGYWVFTSTLFLASIFWRNLRKFFFIILLPFIIGFIDELMQYNNFLFKALNIHNSLWTRTFDFYDLLSYIIGLLLALLLIFILKKRKRLFK